MKKFNFIVIALLLITGCGGLGDAKKVLKNEKTSSTDEFLVKKKEPLVLPPDFDKLPLPQSQKNTTSLSKEKDKIKEILNVNENNIKDKKTSSSIEESIIEKIKWNEGITY